MSETTTTRRGRGNGKPRGSYAKSGVTRAAILEAALDVFARGGYRAGSLREIAEQVGMTEAGVLHHFPNKSALLAAVLDLRDQHSLTMVPLRGEDPYEALRGLITLARYNASVPGVVDLYTTLSAEATSPNHPAHDYFVGRYAFTFENMRDSFQRCADHGTPPIRTSRPPTRRAPRSRSWTASRCSGCSTATASTWPTSSSIYLHGIVDFDDEAPEGDAPETDAAAPVEPDASAEPAASAEPDAPAIET